MDMAGAKVVGRPKHDAEDGATYVKVSFPVEFIISDENPDYIQIVDADGSRFWQGRASELQGDIVAKVRAAMRGRTKNPRKKKTATKKGRKGLRSLMRG